MTKVCHMTSAHDALDDRIYLKECISLQKSGYEVYLVAEGENKISEGVHIVGAGPKPDGRIKRMTSFAKRVYGIAKELDCDIYHFHDPELLPYGLKLKKMGRKVIFDSHEDVAGQIEDKEWIPKFLRGMIASAYHAYETHVSKRIDVVVTATPHIGDLFKNRAKEVVVINNFPKLDDIEFSNIPFEERENIVCYAGGISKIRGMDVMIESVKGLDATLMLAGPCDEIEKLNGGVLNT